MFGRRLCEMPLEGGRSCRRKHAHEGRCAWAPFRGQRIWRLIISIANQGAGAPFVDDAWTTDVEGRRYVSKAILLTPWRRTSFGERPPMRALVIGWHVRTASESRGIQQLVRR